MSVLPDNPQYFSKSVRNFECESLNVNSILNTRSNTATPREICLLSVCGGKNDEFTKTVLDWLHRAKTLTSIHFLLCGPSKCVDSKLSSISQMIRNSEHAEQIDNEQRIGVAPRIHLKRQTNMPTVAQWQVLKPQVVVIGLHYLSERWCAKNCCNELLFPKRADIDETEMSNYESCYQSGDSSESNGDEPSDTSSGEEADVETSEENVKKNSRKKRARTVLVVEKSRRPTLYRTEIYRKAMFVDSLSLVAKYRPKIVFIQNILELSKQAERRRKDQVSWELLLDIAHAFCNETSYQLRPLGLEMKEEKDSEEFPSKDIWCNGMFFERIDNGFQNISQLHYEFTLYNTAESIQRIHAAMKWIFYDHQFSAQANNVISHQSLVEQFSVDGEELFNNFAIPAPKKKKRIKLQTRKSVTIPVQLYFPEAFAKALAYYSIAQIMATSID